MHSRAHAWYARRTSHWRDWPAEALLDGKRRAGARISVVTPARDEERTITDVVGSLRAAVVDAQAKATCHIEAQPGGNLLARLEAPVSLAAGGSMTSCARVATASAPRCTRRAPAPSAGTSAPASSTGTTISTAS